MEKQSVFIAIDLKSFYASVECRERGRDPLTTNLVDGKDHLPCRVAIPEKLWYPGTCQTI